MTKQKAYGFPVVEFLNGDVCGFAYTENGQYLGRWVSSGLGWLKNDLANHAKDFDYIFVKSLTELPTELKHKVQIDLEKHRQASYMS
jgi:hypothetical protein